ncbi:uncharacterized protein LOC104862312 [Fukomys damarensis]|uniref:uncharacterized protein LOC104862312 n=1 Tax=Fukomys damarensis TaxID=885580 RepID=UPI00054008A9|nr:uncharacterized protein LOC104862312 [Fukomys damarensis]
MAPLEASDVVMGCGKRQQSAGEARGRAVLAKCEHTGPRGGLLCARAEITTGGIEMENRAVPGHVTPASAPGLCTCCFLCPEVSCFLTSVPSSVVPITLWAGQPSSQHGIQKPFWHPGLFGHFLCTVSQPRSADLTASHCHNHGQPPLCPLGHSHLTSGSRCTCAQALLPPCTHRSPPKSQGSLQLSSAPALGRLPGCPGWTRLLSKACPQCRAPSHHTGCLLDPGTQVTPGRLGLVHHGCCARCGRWEVGKTAAAQALAVPTARGQRTQRLQAPFQMNVRELLTQPALSLVTERGLGPSMEPTPQPLPPPLRSPGPALLPLLGSEVTVWVAAGRAVSMETERCGGAESGAS